MHVWTPFRIVLSGLFFFCVLVAEWTIGENVGDALQLCCLL